MQENRIIEEHDGVRIVETPEGYRLLGTGDNFFDRCYDEITFDPHDRSFICRRKRDYDSFFLNGMKSGGSSMCTYGDEYTRDGVSDFYRDGKFGCRIGEKEILPPVYDMIEKWSDCDVIYTRKGMEIRYFDLQGNEILKKRRNIEGAADYLEPYYCGEPQNTDIVQTMDMCERPEGEDFCVCHGHHAGLSRRTRREHMDRIREQGAEVCKRFREITLFARDCYIYSAYMVQSAKNSRHPVGDCLRQLEKMDVFFGGWHVILLILAPRRGFNHRITKEELKSVRSIQRKISFYKRVPVHMRKQDRIDCSKNDYIAIDAIFKGVTDRIESGAIVMATLCFADHWPEDDELRKWEEKKKRSGRHAKDRRRNAR